MHCMYSMFCLFPVIWKIWEYFWTFYSAVSNLNLFLGKWRGKLKGVTQQASKTSKFIFIIGFFVWNSKLKTTLQVAIQTWLRERLKSGQRFESSEMIADELPVCSSVVEGIKTKVIGRVFGFLNVTVESYLSLTRWRTQRNMLWCSPPVLWFSHCVNILALKLK